MEQMTDHPDAALSAYLDEALAEPELRTVAAHVAGCVRCTARVAELRAVARLVAAAPGAAPRRSLVPRLVRPPVWLAPARSLAAFAAGVFGFLLLVSTVLTIDPGMGGGGPGLFTTSTQRVAVQRQVEGRATPAPAQAAPAAAPLTATAGSAARDAAKSAASPTPAPVAATAERPSIGSPLVWLALTLAAAGAAIALARRMRAAA